MITYDTYFIDEPIAVYYDDMILGHLPKQLIKTKTGLCLVFDYLELEKLRSDYKIPLAMNSYFNGTDIVLSLKEPSLKGLTITVPYYLEGYCNDTPITLSDYLNVPVQQAKNTNTLYYSLDQLTPVLKPTDDFPKLTVTQCAYFQKGLYMIIDPITCLNVKVSQKPYKEPSSLGTNYRSSVLTPIT